MYSVYGDEVCIYNDLHLTGAMNALTPKLTISDNAAGSFEITLPVGNAGYNTLKRMKSVITVYRGKEEVWSGRIISEKMDFRNNRVLTCEGELAYLNDTIQPPKRYAVSNDSEVVSFGTGVTVLEFLESVINLHNQNVDDEKRFYVDKSYIFNWNEEMPVVCTNYENTLDCINENLITRYGGHLRIRKENGKRYLDWFKEEINTNTQVIRFGQNLLDFTKNWDLSNLATVIIPRGARLDESDISEDITAYVTVEDAELKPDDIPKDEDGNETVTHQGIYVIANAPKENYGWIEKTVDFEDITDPTELLKKAIEYLEETQFDDLSLEVSAVDLQYLNIETESIRILDLIRCVSRPHGLDKLFPVSELSIQLDKPDSAKYTLGTTEAGKNLSSSVNSSTSDISHEIENLPTKQSILTKAKENADLLMKETTNGFVTLVTDEEGGRHSEALVISSEKDYTKADHYWIWNVNGLAHYNKSNDAGKDISKLNAAITMDGAIVANYITTGTMSADRIRTGILESEDRNVVWNLNGYEYTDKSGNTYAPGSLTIKKGSISLGTRFGKWGGSFCVDDEGNMHAYTGTIGGFTIETYEENDELISYLHNEIMTLDGNGLTLDRDVDGKLITVGNIGTNSWKDYSRQVGLTMDLENSAYYISWAWRAHASDNQFTVKLMYTSRQVGPSSLGYDADMLHIGCNVHGHNYVAEHFYINPKTGGADGGWDYGNRKVIIPIALSNDGKIAEYFKVYVRGGFLLPE